MNIDFKTTHRAHDRIDDTRKKYHVGDYGQTKTIFTQYKVFFILAMFTGCRHGELISLTWNDIDFEKKLIDINKSAAYVNHGLQSKSTKNESSPRVISLTDNIVKKLKHLKTEQNRYRLSLGDQGIDGKYLFTQWNGKQMDPSTPYHKFKDIIKDYNATVSDEALKLPDIPLHGLRHTSATLLIAENIDIRTVSNRLGHAQTSTTMNIYAHSCIKKMNKQRKI